MKKLLLFLLLLTGALFSFTSPTYGSSAYQYQVHFEGTQNKAIIQKLQNYSEIYKKRSQAPNSLAQFQKRVREDSKLMIEVLHSMGYYDGQISLLIEPRDQGFMIAINIHTGKLYHINSFRLIPSFSFVNLNNIGITLGMPASADKVLKAEKRLLSLLKNQGHLLAAIKKKKYLVDQKKKNLNATLYISLGPKFYFGKTLITGLHKVDKDFILQRLAWKEGVIYSPQLQQKTLENLEAGGLFNIVDIHYPQPPPNNNILPMSIRLVEGKHRTISSGLSYTIDEGVGVSLGWKHRNIFGMGQFFSFESSFFKRDYSFSGSYRIPYFLKQSSQDLIWTLQRDKETTAAYIEKSSSLSAIIEKKFSSNFILSYGVKLLSLDTTKAIDTGISKLISFPLLAKLSRVNSSIVPTKGWTAIYQIFPYKSFKDRGVTFITQKLKGKVYYPLFSERLILTGSGSVGTILGSEQQKIPTPLRLYAGSFQELPGYKRNSVSPLGTNNTPIGGLSELILGISGTVKFTENFGPVLGYSAGNVYPRRYLKLDEKWLKSWYLGSTYYTAIGPLDMVLAFPLNRRKEIDSSFQFYINLGNSF